MCQEGPNRVADGRPGGARGSTSSKWPAPSTTSTATVSPALFAAASNDRACSIGTIGSRAPQTSRTGTPSGTSSIGDDWPSAVRLVLRGAAEELRDGVAADAARRPRPKVGDAGERDDATEAQGIGDVKRRAPRQARPGREPERELAAGRVAEGDDAAEVERMLLRGLAQVVGPAGHVLERARPAAPGVAEAAVLEAPRRVALGGERRGEAAHVVEAPRRLPAAAVDDDHDRVRAGTLRQPQLGHLLRRRAVGDRVVGRRLRQRQQVLGGHEGSGRRREVS